MYDSHQSAWATMSILVGQEGVDLAATQAGFVNAQMGAYILGINQILRSMLQLVPFAEVTEMLLVLAVEEFAVHTIMVGYALYTFGSALNPPLLKKPQTRGRVWSRIPSDRRSHM